MADTREYKMTITLKGTGNKTQNSSDEEATQPTSVVDTLKNVVKQTKGIAAATGVGMVTTQTLNYVSSRVEVETGNSRVQGQINAAKQISGQILRVAAAGVFGGLAGAGVTAFGIGMNYLMEYSAYDFARSQNNAELQIQRERAGLSWLANAQRRL